MNDLYVNNNGVLILAQTYSIKSGNRGHLYGDGLFETIRIMNGVIINLENHYKRLTEGMAILRMNVHASFTLEFLENQINDLIKQNEIIAGGRIRLSIDRKQGGTFLPKTNEVDFFIEAVSLPHNNFRLNDAGFVIDLYEEMKKPITILSNFKTLNFESQIFSNFPELNFFQILRTKQKR